KKGAFEVSGVRHVDLIGKIVMSALVDAYVHLGYRRGSMFIADNYMCDTFVEILDRYASYGVGAVFEAGMGCVDLSFQVRAEHRIGTRYLTAGCGFAMPNAGPGM